MFNRHSIFFTLTISLIIAILLVVISFFIVLKNSSINEINELKRKYLPIARMVHNQCNKTGLSEELVEDIEDIGMRVIYDEDEMTHFFANKRLKTIFSKSDRRHGVQILTDGEYHYIFIRTMYELFIIQDKYKVKSSNKPYILGAFTLILITIILSFLATVRKLYPLKILKDKVKDLGDEDFEFIWKDNNSYDEVSLLATEFSLTAQKLKKIKEARNVFIRNIMHELKTPITKGKFLVELPDSDENREKFKKVFFRLESLINEFASIEELISKSEDIEIKEYYLEDIVDNASDILMLDEQDISTNISGAKVRVNFKLFTIAVKNLIDNGIKYSDNKKVEIKAKDGSIAFINSGKKLEHELENYFEPFFKDDMFSSDSFGLGLYIVYNILKANNYELKYEYEDGKNYFICSQKT